MGVANPIVEKAWTEGIASGGKLLTLWFDVPTIGESHFIGCYLRYAHGKASKPREVRRLCRLAAREWAEDRMKRHGCR